MTGFRLWAFIGVSGVAALLFAAVLWQQNQLTSKDATIEAQGTRIAGLREANASMREVVSVQAQARIDNDAIANAVASKLGTVKTREINTTTIFEKAKQNDPQTRDWANVAVPSGLQDAINASGPVRASAR